MDQQVLQCLQATLSPEEQTRKHAEEQLKQLFAIPEGGLSLARILLDQNIPLPQRQISVLLQKYIARHWSYAAVNFEEPATPLAIKSEIRPIIFQGLSDPQSKIRSAAAFAISTIAKFDWPDEYPDLLNSLVTLLRASPDSVHGAMRVVGEFVKNDLSEDQLIPVVRDLVPALLQILGTPESHSAATRASTINVFRQVIRMLETVRDEHPAAVKQALDTLCPQWFAAFRQLLSADPSAEIAQSWEYLGIRIEIFRTFNLFLNAFPKVLLGDLATYLELSVFNLNALLPTFRTYYLSTDPDAPEPPEPTGDVGFSTPKTGIDDLACCIFDFLTPAVRKPKAVGIMVQGEKGKETPLPILKEMMEAVMEYIQITRTNEEEWLEDANAFVQDEDEETEAYGMRAAGFDLIGSLIDKWPRATVSVLQELVSRRIQASAEAKAKGEAEWWKPLEATLALLGGIADDVRLILEEDAEQNKQPSIDVQYLFDNIIPEVLNQSETPFLQGRAFVFASHFASSLSEGLAGQYLGAAVVALESPNVSVPVKLSAVKTIKNFCRAVDSEVMQPQSGKILTLLLPLLPEAEGETLYLLLETIRSTLSLDTNLLTAQSVPHVVDQVFQVWLKYSQDPVLTAIVEEFVESLTLLQPDVVHALVNSLCPRLASCIAQPTTNETVHIPSEAVQLSNALLRGRGGPIESELVATVTAAILQLLRTTDDMDVIQNGVVHLTYIVRKDCEKLIQWHGPSGNNGIEDIFALLARFLAPSFSESGGLFVGDLIMHLFRKAGSAIGPVLPDLCRAVAQKLASAKMSVLAVSLVLPFAYLFGTEYTTSTIDLLSSFEVSTEDGQSKSGLQVVLSTWCDNLDTLAGSWDIRVSAMGMSKLFVLPDERLRSVIVKGDQVYTEEQQRTIMTRSKTKSDPMQFTEIPFPLKALKLLLKEVQHVGGEGKRGVTRITEDIEEDDGDEEWDDDDPLADVEEDEFEFLSSWLDGGAKNDNAQDDDEDLISDPLAQIDMGEYLTDVIRQTYSTNSNGIHEMVNGLNDSEKGVLRATLTV